MAFEGPVVALFEATIFVLCPSRRPSSAFVFRPLVPDFGTATDDLRIGAVADFGVSGWIEALSLGSAVEVGEDGPILEFWADAGHTKAAATVTNRKAILHFIIGSLHSAVPFPLALLITTHFRSSDCPKVFDL